MREGWAGGGSWYNAASCSAGEWSVSRSISSAKPRPVSAGTFARTEASRWVRGTSWSARGRATSWVSLVSGH